ncbi:MAG: dihydroorotate dehydrogenase electron transfer subunit [Lachnospiraceae bacterium]|nr:dihydroorotate dehydrogenase electron transfer subunit [Lachnospiraceae bacterium]
MKNNSIKKKESALIVLQEEIAENVYSMWIETDISKNCIPGQFISVYPDDPSKLLPRPISICETDNGRLRIVYRIAGEGTGEFSALKKGDHIDILGPLGNGFPVLEGKAILIGGGIGIPPMLGLARSRNKNDTIIVSGYRNSDMFLEKELSNNGTLMIATEDGSVGIKGNVMDVLHEKNLRADVIYACGPLPMLKAVKEYSEKTGITAYVSMEERMACGIGACLACVCSSTEVDDHSKVKNKRICKDGPVFNVKEVNL